VLGPDHPETLTARHNIAMRTKQAGDLRGAVEQLAAVYDDRVRVLGPQHPDTIITCKNLDSYRDSLTTFVLIVARGAGQKPGPRPQGRKGPERARRRRPRS
jgi:Tetratricopeptide repeat